MKMLRERDGEIVTAQETFDRAQAEVEARIEKQREKLKEARVEAAARRDEMRREAQQAREPVGRRGAGGSGRGAPAGDRLARRGDGPTAPDSGGPCRAARRRDDGEADGSAVMRPVTARTLFAVLLWTLFAGAGAAFGGRGRRRRLTSWPAAVGLLLDQHARVLRRARLPDLAQGCGRARESSGPDPRQPDDRPAAARRRRGAARRPRRSTGRAGGGGRGGCRRARSGRASAMRRRSSRWPSASANDDRYRPAPRSGAALHAPGSSWRSMRLASRQRLRPPAWSGRSIRPRAGASSTAGCSAWRAAPTRRPPERTHDDLPVRAALRAGADGRRRVARLGPGQP